MMDFYLSDEGGEIVVDLSSFIFITVHRVF